MITATVRFSSDRVDDQEVALVTWTLGVQRIALLVPRPEHAACLTNLCWDTLDLTVLVTEGKILVDLAWTSAVLGIALVRVLPV